MLASASPPQNFALGSCCSQAELRIGTFQMSWSKRFEPRKFRAFFAERWSQFLHENYDSPEEVSVAYGVRFQTALNWWQGLNRPSGDVVASAALNHPTEFAEHFGGGQ